MTQEGSKHRGLLTKALKITKFMLLSPLMPQLINSRVF